MTGLKLQIMTESNTLWEPSNSTSLVIKADWSQSRTQNKKKGKGKKSSSSQETQTTSLNLPDIKVKS